MGSAQRARFALIGIVGLGAWLRLWVAFTDEGIYWPDEIYQSFEPAHRLVFGYGMVAWEFVDGARNWALPGWVALWLKVFATLGLDAPAQYIHGVKAVFALMGAGTAWGVYKLARNVGAPRHWALLGAAGFALTAVPLYFGARAMSESAAALPAVWGLALLLKSPPSRRGLLAGASLLGLAVLFRLQMGLFCAGILLLFALRRQWRVMAQVGGVLLVWAFIFGLLDRLTWHDVPGAAFGGWFESAVKYLRFNLIEGKAAGWGTSPWYFYLGRLFTAMPAVAVPMFVGAALSYRRAGALLALAFVFFALHSWVPHKELRFMVPVLPLLFACMAVGGAALESKLSTWLFAPGVAVTVLISLVSTPQLTMGQLGIYLERRTDSAWNDFGAVNRLMLAANAQPDLCGLRVDAAHLAWTGGYTYLHRNVPLYHLGQPPLESRYFNYVVTRAGSGGQVVAREGALELVKLPWAQCQRDAAYSWRLP
ncbi:MAG: hypothetical protein K1X64_06015 [Myxococcaceae bacterium]|nr:hypothetical protein [Myxococcaceae bacterium]